MIDERILKYGIFIFGAIGIFEKNPVFLLCYLIVMNLRIFTLRGKNIRYFSFVFDALIFIFSGGLPFAFTLLTIWDILSSFTAYSLIPSGVFLIFYILINGTLPQPFELLSLFAVFFWQKRDRERELLKKNNEDKDIEIKGLKEEASSLYYAAGINDELIRLRERNRISTEIHDTIGHRLSAIVLQLEALSDGKNPMITELKDYSKETLTQVRMALREMKPKDYDRMEFLINLQNLFSDYKKRFGIEIRFTSSKNKEPLSDKEAHFLYRAVEECLTNAIRHGNAGRVFVHMNFSDDITLTIRDNGKGSGEIIEGMGLKGMKERARELLGEVHYDGERDGFRVNIRIRRGVR